jgi:hypothetical protein
VGKGLQSFGLRAPAIPATWAAEIWRITVRGQPRQIVLKTPHLQNNQSKMDWRCDSSKAKQWDSMCSRSTLAELRLIMKVTLSAGEGGGHGFKCKFLEKQIQKIFIEA